MYLEGTLYPRISLLLEYPYSMWYMVKPSVAHVHILVQVPMSISLENSKKKLDEKSMHCILMGYNEMNNA
jgi:hypothetical protein